MSTLQSMPSVRPMSTLAEEAIAVQDACNLSGIIHSFSRAMTNLREIARAEGWESTDKINTHPICILYADKIASLVSPGSSINGNDFSNAYKWACELTNQQKRSNET